MFGESAGGQNGGPVYGDGNFQWLRPLLIHKYTTINLG